jgi:RNase P subunit RPR2
MDNTKQRTLRCWKCDSPLSPETAIDLRSGMSIQQYACLSCGRRWYGGEPVQAFAA